MTRRAMLIVALALLAAPVAADAQQAGKVYRIGVLCTTTCENPAVAAFRQALRGMGHLEGQNIALEWRQAEGQLDRLATLAAELVALKVDIILSAGGTATALAAKGATGTIPIVMGTAGDPVRSRLVASLARPGGNITGLSIQGFELNLKRLELLKQAVPKISRVGFLWAPGIQPGDVAEAAWEELQTGAQSLGMTLQRQEVRSRNDFRAAFSTLAKERANTLLVANTAPLTAHLTEIAELAASHRLPAIAEPSAFARAGGLLAYGVSYSDMYRRAAGYVDRILKGAKPADLPIEQPTKFELVVNLRTAKALGLTIPPLVLARADEVIE